MSKDRTKFVMTVTIKREDENALVYYKQDGQRFKVNCTVKMNVETTYKFLLTFRPPQIVKTASLKGTCLDVKEEEASTDSSSYSFLWTSNNVCISKKNNRDQFPLAINLQGLDTLEIMLQSKLYKADDTHHSVWGNALHHIEYECVYKSETSSFDVEKEIFR